MTEQHKTFNIFLSMPYGSTNDERLKWNALATAIKKVAAQSTETKLKVQLAKDQVEALNLKRSVMHLIDESHFTVAVTTGNNPNVLWEVGYTEAQKNQSFTWSMKTAICPSRRFSSRKR